MLLTTHPSIQRSILLLLVCLSVCVAAPQVHAVDMSREDLYKMATLAARDGEFEHAVEFFKRTIDLDPRFAPAYNSLGVIYETSPLKDLNEAIRYFKLATETDPASVESWNNLGRAYYTRGDFRNAEKVLLKSVALNADQPDVNITLGWIYLLGQSRGEEAQHYFEKGVGKVDNVMVYYGIGLSHIIQNNKFKALDSITELRRKGREDMALKLEEMLKNRSLLKSEPGMPLVTGAGEAPSVLSDAIKALGKSDGSPDGIQVRLRGPLAP